MKVDPQSWPILSRLMDEWLDQPPEQRDGWLASLEPEHADILPVLRELLSQPNPRFLETLPEIEDTASTQGGPAPFAAGMLAGPYRLVRELGRGGMGVVWLAERADNSLKREVALKLPLLFLHGPAFADRFARERDILARLADARIARLYDAGITAQGQPYLALEYVEGEAITAYCDRLCLDIRARLKLFLDVLQAVQYAHANLVVHRDLKPSNILVTNAGQVRLLDFGIAKLLAEGEAEETEITRFGGRALTPGYASPEQISGGVITTATDVYSLGILLYELLTGGRPYKVQGESGHMLDRVINTNPVRPSQAARDESMAAVRGAGVKKLAAALRGDLDTIVLKAIQKDPRARYSTADAFAQDIERHLAGQPVTARPEGAWYRTKKFVLRNKLAVSSAAAVVLALTAGAGVALWQAHRALEERRRADIQAASARAVVEFLQNDLLSQAGSDVQAAPGLRPDPDLKVRVALDRAAARITGKFDGQPAVEAAIRQTLGETYMNLGIYAEAQQHMERAFELRRRVSGPENPETLGVMAELAEIYRREGKYGLAETVFTNLVEIQRRTHQEDAVTAIEARHALASLVSDWHADYGRAEAMYWSVLETERRVVGESDRRTLATTNNLAELLSREGKYAQAEDVYKKLIETKRRVLGAEHPSTLISMNGLGALYRTQGKLPEAESLLTTVFDTRMRVLGAEHADTLGGMNSLGLVYLAEGKYAEAERLFNGAVEAEARLLGDANPLTLSSRNSLAELYRRENKLGPAEGILQGLLVTLRSTSGMDSAIGLTTIVSLGRVKFQQHAYGEAETLLRRAEEGYRKSNLNTWRRYFGQCLLGASLESLGRPAEGEPMLTAGYQSLLRMQESIPFEYRAILPEVRQWTAKPVAERR